MKKVLFLVLSGLSLFVQSCQKTELSIADPALKIQGKYVGVFNPDKNGVADFNGTLAISRIGNGRIRIYCQDSNYHVYELKVKLSVTVGASKQEIYVEDEASGHKLKVTVNALSSGVNIAIEFDSADDPNGGFSFYGSFKS